MTPGWARVILIATPDIELSAASIRGPLKFIHTDVEMRDDWGLRARH